MDPVWKEKWVEALTSGEYQQAEGALRKIVEKGEVRHCCLGVLMEVGGCKLKDGRFIATGTVEPEEDESGKERLVIVDDPDCEFIGSRPAKKFGITAEQQQKLAKFNDAGKSFRWIASYIKRYL